MSVAYCHTLESLSHDPHLVQVGLLQPDEHPTEGDTLAIRSTIRFDDSYGQLPAFAQPQGWETRAILNEIGYSEDEVDGLIADMVAIAHAP